MTDIQIPLPQSHQKGMNGKFSPKNTLEIRGYSGNSTQHSSNQNNTGANSHLANSVTSSTPTPATTTTTTTNGGKKSLKLIDKSQSTNIHLYPIKLNSTSEKDATGAAAAYGTIVSFNLINNLSSSSNMNGGGKPQQQQNTTRTTPLASNSKNFKSFTNNESSGPVNYDRRPSTLLNNKENEGEVLANASNPSSHHHHHHQQQGSSHPWHDESNSGWTSTGVMSDRSSVYSIDDGDFDREASRKVNNQLKEIESILYEQNSTLSSNLIECKEWLEKFPHLRILGKQMPQPRDRQQDMDHELSSLSQSQSTTTRGGGNHSHLQQPTNISSNLNLSALNINDLEKSLHLATSAHVEATESKDTVAASHSFRYNRRREMSDLSHNQTLYLNGTSLPIKSLHDDKSSTPHQHEEDFAYLEEEIIEQEGTYEELLAYDNQEEEYMFEHNKRLNLNKRRRHGLPPISPKAAMKDLVANMVFDYLWSELIKWSEPTIRAYYSFIREGHFSGQKPPQSKADADETPTASPRKIDSARPSESNFNETVFANETKPAASFSKYDLLQQLEPAAVKAKSANEQHHPTTSNHQLTSSANAHLNLWGKPNVLLIKPFDSNANSSAQHNGTMLEVKSSSLTPSLLSRDNSTLYAQSTKFAMNESNFESKFNSYLANDGEITGGIDDLLTIKQLNRNGTTKTLSPITQQQAPQSRIGSGNRRQPLSSSFKKRYSSIDVSSGDKNNIAIHGAGLAKPSFGHASEPQHPNSAGAASSSFEHKSNPNSGNTNSTNHASSSSSSSSAMHHGNQYSSMSIASSNSNNLPTGATISRSNNNSSQFYHHLLPPSDESTFENDELSEYPLPLGNANVIENGGGQGTGGENTIDEINLLNLNSSAVSNMSSSKFYANHGFHGGHYGFYHHHHHHGASHSNNSSSNAQQLPPIEKSLVLKPMRISSATNSNLKQIKEKTERPMTSTATRHETNALALHKRSTTPSGLGSHGRGFSNMQITGVRLSADDSLYSSSHNHNHGGTAQLTSSQLSNFLSTKPYNFNLNQSSGGAPSRQGSTSTNNRRNSKDIQTILKLNP